MTAFPPLFFRLLNSFHTDKIARQSVRVMADIASRLQTAGTCAAASPICLDFLPVSSIWPTPSFTYGSIISGGFWFIIWRCRRR